MFLLFRLPFMLIKLCFMLLWLPFKILIEIAEHSGRRRPHARRTRTRATRSVRTVQQGPFTAARPLVAASASPWALPSRDHKVLAVFLGLFAVLGLVGAVLGATISPGSPQARPSVTRAASIASGGLEAAHHNGHHVRKHRHRKHHGSTTRSRTAASPATASPTPAGCYPIAASGNCYEPGEFCPHADAGMSGVAGDGERIVCQDNDGLRWEPA